jgi:hypothetical protein
MKSKGVPFGDKPIRIAMLGMIDGNAHPYSWSAIINGYNPEAMEVGVGEKYPGIVDYLGAEPFDEIGVDGATVTHVWTDDPEEAPKISAASLVPNVVKTPEDVIGEVDLVVISVDDGDDHVRRVAPFIEAGLPVFIDKPMATNIPDLQQFIDWEKEGHFIMSSSGLRYAPAAIALREELASLGELRWISSTSAKTWERCGIHALEAIYPLIGPGLKSIRLESQPGSDIGYILHESGVQLTLPIIYDMVGSFGLVDACGTAGHRRISVAAPYRAFRDQLVAVLHALRVGRSVYPFSETTELMATIIAGIRSRSEKGRLVSISEIMDELTL